MDIRHTGWCLGAPLLALAALPAQALNLDFLDGEITGTLNSTATFGAAVRMEHQARNLVGKVNQTPDGCSRQYQTCVGLFRDQSYPAERLVALPGQFSMRGDDGNINYDQYDLTQGVGKLNQDLSLNWGGFGFFARWLYFYDAVNNDFTETHPNLITPDNVQDVGITGDPVANRYFPHVYGPGAKVRSKRRNGKTLDAVGNDFQLLDANIFGRLPLFGDHELSFKLGRQTVNWGESTLLAINSVNQANPVNANNLFRLGTQIDEIFTPIAMAFVSIEPFANATVEAFYQLEWKPLEAPPPGSYFSANDLGTNNNGKSVNFSFGSSPEDPDRAFDGDTDASRAGYFDNPLTLITPTTGTLLRERDIEPGASGQFGLAFKYYAENLGSGTEFGFYFMNYHSRLPYVSFFAAQEGCGRHATNTAEFLSACNNIPALANTQARLQLLQDATLLGVARPGVLLQDVGVFSSPQEALETLRLLVLGGDSNAQLDDAISLDSPRIALEYPENIQMYGFSFNTTLGNYSLQGEIAYRPNLPLQVSVTDLGFAALAPTLTLCHRQSANCAGTTAGSGFDENGNRTIYGSSDFVDADGNNPYPDTINLLVGHAPGSARSFPSFIIPYRGGVVGENAATDLSQPLNRSNPGYIKGYERFEVYQFNFGLTRVLGATENYIKADQVQIVGEWGATWVPGLPSLDELQIDAPGVYLHASAGADGSGADGSQQACSSNLACSYGADGLRFNPHQADLDDFVDKFSWGYRVITIIKYESILPAISLQPFIIWAHDVHGTSPGPAENFVESRKSVIANLETRYKDWASFTIGYTWFFGAGENNLLRDRDFAQAFVKLQF